MVGVISVLGKLEVLLTLKALIKTAAVDIWIFQISYFFPENKAWHLMWIICLADNSH